MPEVEVLRDFLTDTVGHVRAVLLALSSSNTFVVSGAGLPIPIIQATDRMTLDLRRARRRQIPFYRTGEVSRSPFRDRLWAVPRYNPNIADQPSLQLKEREELRKDSWLAGDPDELVDALFRQGIYREVEALPPANYRVFDYVPPHTTIFDFNCDGLVGNYCAPRHIVINPHGRIDRIWGHPQSMNLLRAAARGWLLPNSTKLVLPGPEPATVTWMREYKDAALRLSTSGKFIVVIGYSFGRQRNGSIDDAESFEFVCEFLRKYPRRIVVVDPCPEHVAGLFENALRQRIYACKLYWNHLAEAACLAMEENPGVLNLLAVQSRVVRLYNERALGLVSEISG